MTKKKFIFSDEVILISFSYSFFSSYLYSHTNTIIAQIIMNITTRIHMKKKRNEERKRTFFYLSSEASKER